MGARHLALAMCGAVLASAPERCAAAAVVPAGAARLALPRGAAAGSESWIDVPLRLTRELLLLEVVSARVRGLDGAPLAPGVVRFELAAGPAGAGPDRLASGSEVLGRLEIAPGALAAAGEYPLDLILRVVPATASADAAGPPAPIEEPLLLSLSRRLATLSATHPARIEVPTLPWQPGISGQLRVHLAETSGQMALPALEVAVRGAAVDVDQGGRAASLALTGPARLEARAAEAADLDVPFAGQVGAGRYRLPLEIRSGGAAAPLPVDIEVWVRHPPALLAVSIVLGVLLGWLFAALARRKEGGEERARILARGRMVLERHLASAVDRPLAERLSAIIERLRRKQQHAGFGIADPHRVVVEAESEALMALRDLESRRLAAERALVHLESALQPASSDAPEVESVLAAFLRRAEELRHRLDRGEVTVVETEVAALRIEASRAIGEAGRRWLMGARDLLEALRQRIPQSSRVQLFESVRLSLETFAGRIAEGSVERIRDTIVAGRAAATTLSEQCFALAYKPALRDLAELLTVLADFLPEAALRSVEGARRTAESALEPGPLSTPLRPLETLSDFQDVSEQAIATLAGEAWSGDGWKAVREAASLREYARVAEAVESVLRHRVRDRATSTRRARVLEIVRLAPRPSPPAFRVGWDSPPVVGFPVIARVVWLGLEPRRFAVSWAAEGLDVKVEKPSVASTSLVFLEPGWASLRALVEVEGEPAPLVAQARLRVLPEAAVTVSRRPARAGINAWGLGQALLAAALATTLGTVWLAAGFTGTPRDYALGAGFGLLFELVVDRIASLRAGARSPGPPPAEPA